MASAAAAQPVTIYEMFEEMVNCVHDLREGFDRIEKYINPIITYLWLLKKYSGISESVYDFWTKLIKEVAFGTNRRNLNVADLHAIVIPFLSANLEIKAPEDVAKLKGLGFQKKDEDTLEGSQFLVMLGALKDKIIEKRQTVRDAEELLLSFDKQFAPGVLNFSATSTLFNDQVEKKRTENSQKWKESLTKTFLENRHKLFENKSNMDISLKSLAEEVKKLLPATEVDLTDVQSMGDNFVQILSMTDQTISLKTKCIAEGKIFLDAYLKKFLELVKHTSVQQQEKFGKDLQRQEALFMQQIYVLQRCLNSLYVGNGSKTIHPAKPAAQGTAQPQSEAQRLLQTANAIKRKMDEIFPFTRGLGAKTAHAKFVGLSNEEAKLRRRAESLLLQEKVRTSQQKRSAGGGEVSDYPSIQAGPAQLQPLVKPPAKRSKQDGD
jgi:hypothetical protein